MGCVMEKDDISTPEVIDLLVGADVLYTLDEMDPVILGGEVAIREGCIVYSGPARAAGHWQAKEKITGCGRAVLPGFVNCHSHAASAVFRSQSDDGLGGQALYSVAFRTEKDISVQDWNDLARLGVIDMIQSGFTTINDIWYEPEALAQAAVDAGLRAQIALKVFDVRLETLYRNHYERVPGQGEDRLRLGVEFAEKWQGAGGGLVSSRLGPHATDTCSAALHQEACAEAGRLGVGLHTHVGQSLQEIEYCRSTYGKGPGEFLADLGVLSDRSVLAHLTFASPEDLDAIAASGAGYAHCPTIYPRRGVYPDLSGILERGIQTGIATDWMMNDPFEAVRNVMNAMRLFAGRHDALTSLQALRLATIGSAEVLGMSDEIGSLAAGKKADLIQVELERAHLQPFYAEPASIAYYARASDVVTSVIDGRLVMADRLVAGLDEASIVARVKSRIPRWLELMKSYGGVGTYPGCPCG